VCLEYLILYPDSNEHLLVISDSALLPSSATGGGRKATNRIVCKHDTNKTVQYVFTYFGFATKTNGDH
jgi:hypothetical protein